MASLRAHINEKCKDCSYDPANPGNWRQQVTNCDVPKCPLYPVRPITRPQNKGTVKEKVEG